MMKIHQNNHNNRFGARPTMNMYSTSNHQAEMFYAAPAPGFHPNNINQARALPHPTAYANNNAHYANNAHHASAHAHAHAHVSNAHINNYTLTNNVNINNSNNIANRPIKTKQVLPCFNLVCTGTCAYGPKCTFLHDPRAQLPKHIRKPVEFVLQSHLHTFRPNLKSANKQGMDDDETASCSGSECSSNEEAPIHFSRPHSPSSVWSELQAEKDKLSDLHKSKVALKRDDIFFFPTVSMTYQEPNSKCYEPTEFQFSSQTREMSMWCHLLDSVNDKSGMCKHSNTKRLPVFEHLSYGYPL